MSGYPRRRRLAAGLAAAGVAAALLAGGCSDSDPAGNDASDQRATTEERGDAAGGAGVVDRGGAPPAQVPAPGAPQEVAPGVPTRYEVDQRAIIYTGSITVRVENVDAAATQATAIATTAGGFVGTDKRTANGDTSEASLTLRIPAARFTAVVDELSRLGDEQSRGVNTDDVTEAVIELDVQIANQQASVDSVRRLFGQARTLAEIVSLERELTQRQTELATMQAKKRRLNDLTSLSTITVVLLGPEAKTPEGEPQTGFLAGLRSGWNAFTGSLEVLVTVLGALLPWLLALGLPVFALIWFSRRRYGRRAARPLGPPSGPPPPPPPGSAGPAGPATPVQQPAG